MNEDILKIGEVIEVRGQKIRASVFSDKNESILNYQGNLIKNVSVGSFVKIRKGFQDIIGKIEGEFTLSNPVDTLSYYNKVEKIVRVIEISLVGYIDRGREFKRGLVELPLISNYVYVLIEEEVEKVFAFTNGTEDVISIGNIIGYNQYKLKVGVQNLFASHIGIFGNTGSGKSNTLAKIYKEVFDKYSLSQSFIENSRFIVIDFNGEYAKSITVDNKQVYHLSTRAAKDTYPITKEQLLDLEFWAIILEATEKTQQPFLKKVTREIEKIIGLTQNEVLSYLVDKGKKLVNHIFEYADKYLVLKRYYQEILSIAFKNIDGDIYKLFNLVGYHTNCKKLYIPGTSVYFDNKSLFMGHEYVESLLEGVKEENVNIEDGVINWWDIFEFIAKYQYVYDVAKGFINEEHIAPLLRRLDNRLVDTKKIFDIVENEETQKCLQVISLTEVNIHMRKIVPMLICKRAYETHKNCSGENKVLHIIIDEAHNILSRQSERESSIWKDYRLEIFEEIIKEGRKFGVFLTIASQRPSDISETIISQLHNYFLHRLVNNEDIKAIARSVAFLDGASFEMIPILSQGGCIFTGTASNFPVLVKIDKLEDEFQPKSHDVNLAQIWGNIES